MLLGSKKADDSAKRNGRTSPAREAGGDSSLVRVPLNYPCATFFVDESGAKATSGHFFVVGCIKTRRPGMLLRRLNSIRDQLDQRDELKFSRINRNRLGLYSRVIETLAESDAHLSATVVDRRSKADPFAGSDPEWMIHARITAKLLVGSINERELGAAVLDHRSTPTGTAFDDTVRGMANHRLKTTGFVSVLAADSRCTDGLQLADLFAGAVGHQRLTPNPDAMNHKAKVAATLAAAFGVKTFSEDVRTDRVNILTMTSVSNS